ncbi:MAG TPA: antibiotic biosynthesis monooxygenase [Gallionellaceae bacterium]|nr:antibiotic biosynthesis monooxygenase [Gallionellaceae bacterium]
MSDTIITMRFRLQPGRSKEDWLKANERASGWVRRQPGFQFRSLSETGDGEWIIIAYWASPEAIDAAEERFAREMGDELLPFVEMDSFRLDRSAACQMLKGLAEGQAA